jgi:hypothetical protein
MSDIQGFFSWMTQQRGITVKGGPGSGRYPKGSGEGSGKSGIFSDYDQMSADDFSGELSKMSGDIAPEVKLEPLENSNLKHATEHGLEIAWPSYDESSDTV